MHTMTINRTLTVTGAAAFLWGIGGDGVIDKTDLRALGLIVFVGSLMWTLSKRSRRCEDEVYEAGRQAGYDAGWSECRRMVRPTVVKFQPTMYRSLADN